MLKFEQNTIITPNQCRAAREMLEWKQEELAKKSEVAIATIGTFERGDRIPYPRTLRAIRTTFENAGIEFENDEKAYGVKLKNLLYPRTSILSDD